MSIESRLKRGDDPKDVAKLFKWAVEDCIALQQKLTAKPKRGRKKTAKKD